jgi:hypothetical protein
MLSRNCSRYAKALDLHLAGVPLSEIAENIGVTKSRAGQIVQVAKAQLAKPHDGGGK